MSDYQKQQRPGATPIKNPLLSASVTGLTFDDFPNKPLLLPAAPPIVNATVPVSVTTPTALLAREPKSLVTVGSSSLDTENLDEINLNTSAEDNQSIETSDLNDNPLLEPLNQGANSDSILSQAASSFSALPSVASNVFSTFSKRITAISSRETTPTYDQHQEDSNVNASVPQIDIQPTYTQQQQKDPQQGGLAQAAPPFYAPPQGGSYFSSTTETYSQQNIPEAEPPKFYSPTDLPSIPSTVASHSANVGGHNNFRFSSKKKLYAPIPGLSDHNQKPAVTLDPTAVHAPVFFDAGYTTSNSSYQQPQFGAQYSTFEEQKPEDQKVSSGLFSKISNLAPTGVLQNITGLVQSAAGSLTQTIKSDSYQQAHSQTLDQQNNYFAGPPPPPTNYFVPPSLSGQQTNYESTSATIANTQLSSIASGQQLEHSSSQPTNIFSPSSTTATLQPVSVFSINKPSESIETLQTQIPLFNPSNLPPHINPNVQPSRPSRPPSRHSSHPTSSYLPSNSNEQSVTTFFNPTQSNSTESTLNTAAQVNFFDPSKYLPPTSQTSATSHPLPTLTTEHKIPPPTGGHTSYRLQKGTKLYKNPLTPQETAPINTTPIQIQAINQSLSTYPTQEHFTTPESVSLFAQSNPNHSIQSVPFFIANPVEGFVSDSSVQSVPLFAPVKELKLDETTQSVELLVPTKNPIQITEIKEIKSEQQHLFAPPAKKVKSNVLEENDLQTSEAEGSLTDKATQPLASSESQFLTETSIPDTDLKFVENKETQKIVVVTQEESIEDPLEITLQKLSLTSEAITEEKPLKLPPIDFLTNFKCSNIVAAKPVDTQPSLANFFTPLPSSGSGDLNFFATLPPQAPSLDDSCSGVNFFSGTAQDIEIDEPNLGGTTNLFTTDFKPELIPLQPDTSIQPPITAFFPQFSPKLGPVPSILDDKADVTKHLSETFLQENIPPPPIGFESFIQSDLTASIIPDSTTVQQEKSTVQHETKSQTQQPEIVNRFSNYFEKTNQQSEIAKDPAHFFDSITGKQLTHSQKEQQVEITAPSVATNEEQRIQYFFNNPPPKDASAVGDLNYDLVHSGLGVKNIQQRSLTPVSNLVEPPSSACSEFSEISNSTADPKSIAANLSITDTTEKSIKKEEIKRLDNRVLLEQNTSVPDGNTKYYDNLPEEILNELIMANILSADKSATTPVAGVSYKSAVKHWFFKRTIGDKEIWVPFSHYDSALLETSLLMEGEETPNIVAVEGGRYDVNISERKKMSVYWESKPIEVRRCSWFYKAVDSKYVPYEEQTADLLENAYKQAAESGVWHKTIYLDMGEQVIFHGPTVIVHFQKQQNADAWGGTTQTATRPRVVKRDLDDFNIEQGESQKVDHLLFMVHGIGAACDLKLRSVEEVVEDFRTIARQLVQSHYKNSTDLGLVGRVEVLPISWHSHLHSVEMGIDEKLRMITLESIPKLRNFTNDTLLDILFYTSPTFCQKIMNTIVQSMNTLYLKYRERHPEFNGGVSLAGHSLGSLILFDLLCHQNPIKESEEKNIENPDQFLAPHSSNTQMDSNQLEDKQISYTMGPAGTGQPFISYAQLIFQPKKFFALGSPIGMFVTIRGIDKLGLDFRLPTCPGFYNIFHPYDPVAYRIEALVNTDLSGIRPVLIPHHKGRKRMHLELKETMTRVSMDLKNRFLDKFKTTLNSVNIFGSTSKSTKEAEELMEQEVDKVIQMQMQLEQQNHNQNSNDKLPSENDSQNGATATPRQRTDSVSTAMSDDIVELEFPLGKLNDSKRIDYVLQEAPLEFINEYIFALSSHVCYWDSEDTILFVMKEIYSGLGISPDSQVPQQTMTIERPSSRNSLISSS